VCASETEREASMQPAHLEERDIRADHRLPDASLAAHALRHRAQRRVSAIGCVLLVAQAGLSLFNLEA
jgi:hypothetical protein